MTPTRLIAGAMSGTSADGVDVAITRISGRGLAMTAELVRHHHRPYDEGLKRAIFALRGEGKAELREIARVGREVSLTYAAAVTEALNAANLKASDLACIAAHGQTLFHDVPLTIQYFDPSLVAYEVGCPVVSDFRRADIAAGGQGAPLVPFADYILFRHPTKTRVLLNLGGIANITYLKAGGTPNDVIAFDTGPANCISDYLCRTRGAAGMSCDVGGTGAIEGTVIGEVVPKFLSASYFVKKAPKSTDGPEMIDLFERALPPGKLELNDLLATASYLTAATVHQAVAKLGVTPADEVIASGGGIYNSAIMIGLEVLFAPAKIHATGKLGVPPDAKEALAFALLGAATLDGVPSNVPSVTGARRGVVLGSVTPRP